MPIFGLPFSLFCTTFTQLLSFSPFFSLSSYFFIFFTFSPILVCFHPTPATLQGRVLDETRKRLIIKEKRVCFLWEKKYFVTEREGPFSFFVRKTYVFWLRKGMSHLENGLRCPEKTYFSVLHIPDLRYFMALPSLCKGKLIAILLYQDVMHRNKHFMNDS